MQRPKVYLITLHTYYCQITIVGSFVAIFFSLFPGQLLFNLLTNQPIDSGLLLLRGVDAFDDFNWERHLGAKSALHFFIWLHLTDSLLLRFLFTLLVLLYFGFERA